MKKAIISIMVLGTLSGCYKDKGSYDYHLDQMNEIKTVSFIPATVNTIAGKTIELQQPLNEEQTTGPVSYTHLTLPTTTFGCRSRWSPYH